MTFYQRLVFKLVRRAINFSRSRQGVFWLAVAGVLESSVIPFMVEFFAIPMMFANRRKIPLFVLVLCLSTVVGACISYALGYFMFDTVGQWLLATLNLSGDYQDLQQQIATHGFWTIMIYGVTPLPLHPLMLVAGFVQYNFGLYVAAVAITRIVRYSFIGGVIYYFGQQLRVYAHERRRKNIATKMLATVTGAIPPPAPTVRPKLDSAA